MMDKERKQWVEVVGFPGYYVNYLGQIKGKRGNILKPQKGPNGYLIIRLRKEGHRIGKTVHSLVAKTLIPNPKGLKELNHKDGNKANNCIDNLEWCTRKDNLIHKYRVLGYKSVLKKPVVQYDVDGNVVNIFESVRDAAKYIGISESRISSCCYGKPRCKTSGGYKWSFIN